MGLGVSIGLPPGYWNFRIPMVTRL